MGRAVLLCILDGWGLSDDEEYNAIKKGNTPFFDLLDRKICRTQIEASGEAVGLPAGQMGNSEVGHLNIGAGRVVMQDLARINRACEEGTLLKNRALLCAMRKAKKNGTKLHLFGLVSDGGVHSDINHIYALLKLAKLEGLDDVYIHAITDGRDTPPDSAFSYIRALEEKMDEIGVGKIASVTGRFYAMDRDKRWNRVEKAFNAFVYGEAQTAKSAGAAVTESYDNKIFDEFIEPVLINDGEGIITIAEEDEVIAFNFRADRMREIIQAFYDKTFDDFKRRGFSHVAVTTMTEYHPDFNLPVAFDVDIPRMGLGEVAEQNKLKQFRTAETEKYAHVTFFFNGGLEKQYEGESRRLVPSPKVRTYDLQPAMSCDDVTDGVVQAVEDGHNELIIVNLANGDMVGHTGIWEAALLAVETIDKNVERIVKACEANRRELLITADHGNIECMFENGKPMTAHTTNKVPLYYIGKREESLREGGALCDLAPTLLDLMEIKKPEEMTGRSLFEN